MMMHFGILIAVFFLMVGVVELIPEIFKIFRERYMADMVRTTRELDKFFLRVKPTRILLISVSAGALLGVATGSWVISVAIAMVGLIAPKLILSLWKEIRSAQVEAQLMDALLMISNSLK